MSLVVCGEVEALDIVLSAGAPASSADVHGGFPVHYAAQMCGPHSEMGNDVRFGLAVLRRLLQAPGLDVNVRDRDGRQPILWAASAGSADAILALVNAGANVEAEDKDGLTGVGVGSQQRPQSREDTASAAAPPFWEYGAAVIGQSPTEWRLLQPPLLFRRVLSVDVMDSHGCTALFYAATLGHADATRLLLGHGADPNRQDRKGRTPAHCGAAKGQLETLRLLAAHGASLWLRNVRGDLPVHEAVASGRTELVRWLLGRRPDAADVVMDHGALLNPVMRSGRGAMLTPLDAALHRGNRGVAKYLQLHGGVPAARLTDKAARLRGATQQHR
ncbi:serine/threonine-protein phosphatase 6 regulatory ankyrin repeat subunit A-like [Schistocerca cancellata]|uniref:serine/threonine-protein phosphatase 6 regulatory ankyrin repeat subunit A-like n=1 Tax=Schistocerca cancellata TaxID=274614 RepID=UPI00211911EF|nr:serine/threonine-protein phosphatase 6 regulatory ankyrin repeat subunit A-like [Schistocerca cancellata]